MEMRPHSISGQGQPPLQDPDHRRPHEQGYGFSAEVSKDKKEVKRLPDHGEADEQREGMPLGSAAAHDLPVGMDGEADLKENEKY
jgi:hypothetical protein